METEEDVASYYAITIQQAMLASLAGPMIGSLCGKLMEKLSV